MFCDKDFGYVTLTWGLTWEYYGDLWQLTCVEQEHTNSKKIFDIRYRVNSYFRSIASWTTSMDVGEER